jgi:ABC-type maltose transport system permease subunit
VDGASGWQVFWVVLLPLVRPILVVVALLTFIGTYPSLCWRVGC